MGHLGIRGVKPPATESHAQPAHRTGDAAVALARARPQDASGSMEGQLRPGAVVGRYTIVEAIGSGMSGHVYSATRPELRQQVALKLMHAEHPDSDAERKRFAREAELVKKLQHPHVVPLLDYGHAHDGRPFLVFSLLRGRSLEDKVRQDGAMSWASTGRFAAQVLRALEKAHGMGIVHRDIKPANIFMVSGVVGEVAQVLDFGLARLVGEPDELDSAGQRVIAGTPRYMAPEQVRGGRIGHEADIYSFGLVMAEMLLGRPLVQGETEMEMYVTQGSDRPIEIPEEVLSSPFGMVIQRAISKTVQVRYHLASQMLADVRAAVERMGAGDLDDDEDDEDELEATAFLDPEEAQRLLALSPQAEKMRKALNLAASKAEAVAEQKRAPEIEATAAEELDFDPGELDALERGDPFAAFDEPAISDGFDSPAERITRQPGVAPAAANAEGPKAREDPSEPVATTQAPTNPVDAILAADAAPPPAVAAAPVSGEAAASVAQAAPPSRTLMIVALVVVLLLIVAGLGAIVWLLGLAPKG